MPIAEKIDNAKQKYDGQLKDLREAAGKEPDISFEKDLMKMLADMIETKTEIEILTRVENHRNSHTSE